MAGNVATNSTQEIKGGSIRHFPAAHPVPDWRNFGVMLRVLLGINLLAALTALIQASDLSAWLAHYLDLAALVEPALLLGLGVLAALRDVFWRMSQRLAQAAVVLVILLLVAGLQGYARSLGLFDGAGLVRTLLLSGVATVVMLAYFEWRGRAFSPALAEARLAALNARIRPHFLFNSLNAVLSLVRAQPRQAEAAIEALADLFRAALRDPAEGVSLSEEIALARQYLDLEKLRLGERLAVDWQIEAIPVDMPIPPLLLQPLLENAVHHGIEPLPEGGVIHIAVLRRGDELSIRITNPNPGVAAAQGGHHMAIPNVRERLSLYYDLEARLEIDAGRDTYQVNVVLPCRTSLR